MRAQSMTAELRRPKSVTVSAFQSEFRKPQLSQDPYEHLDKAYTQQAEKTGRSTAMYRIRGCFDVHSTIMPFLTMTDMVQVRAMSRFSRALMCQLPWDYPLDLLPRASFKFWAGVFPQARAICLSASSLHQLRSDELILRDLMPNLRSLRIGGDNQSALPAHEVAPSSDSYSRALPVVDDRTLSLARGVASFELMCTRCIAGRNMLAFVPSLTDAAFRPLASSLRELTLHNASFADLSDAAFECCTELEFLDLKGCNQPTITGAFLKFMPKLVDLCLADCNQRELSDSAFVHLQNMTRLRTLDLSGCKQLGDAAFAHLPASVDRVCIDWCMQDRLTSAAFANFRRVKHLSMKNCSQNAIDDAAFEHLQSVRTLDMSFCSQETITSAAFQYLGNLDKLNMSHCEQDNIGSSAFQYLRNISSLIMHNCDQRTITDVAFANTMPNLSFLDIRNCVQLDRDRVLRHLASVVVLSNNEYDPADLASP